ncbi:MAG: sigma-70 family RNA polymerase sigma factor [bacterium]|nr:sigma-70 family RNA polymerase sigma factor [bacterium]
MHDLNAYDIYSSQIPKRVKLSKEEEKEILIRIKEGDSDAKTWFILNNLSLVIKIASRFPMYKRDGLDMIEDGNIYLMKAIEYYDVDKGNRFSTYACICIKNGIIREMLKRLSNIRMPEYMYLLLNRYWKCYNELSSKLDRVPTFKELSSCLNISEEKVSQLNNWYCMSISWESMIEDQLLCSVSDDFDFEEVVEKRVDIKWLLDILSPNQRELVEKKYGLIDSKERSLMSLANELGVSRETVRKKLKQCIHSLALSNRAEGYNNCRKK